MRIILRHISGRFLQQVPGSDSGMYINLFVDDMQDATRFKDFRNHSHYIAMFNDIIDGENIEHKQEVFTINQFEIVEV